MKELCHEPDAAIVSLRRGPDRVCRNTGPSSGNCRYELFLNRLRDGVRSFNMEDDEVQFAAEIVSFVPDDCDAETRKALTLLALCALVAVRQGNTFLPLGKGKGDLAEYARA